MNIEKYVAALDVGTTTIRCFIYDTNLQVRGSAVEQVELLYLQLGYVEIEPEKLWKTVLLTISNAMRDARLTPADIHCMGITTQRSTFITWDRRTGQSFHNFITWKDLRADSLVKKWNSSLFLKTMHGVSYCLFLLTRQKRFLAGSVLKFMNTQTTLRLCWVLQNNKDLQEAIKNKTALFGTIDSWILYKLHGGNLSNNYTEHISDVTNCAATGFYDPFTLSWAKWALSIFSIEEDILPKVVKNTYDFGYINKAIFGSDIRIGCTISDQSASMWGSCCFEKGDVKITLGTGSFLNLNTASQCHASIHGLYPLVAWWYKNYQEKEDELVYCVEGSSNDTGSIIKWAMEMGLFTDPAASSDIANSVDDTDGAFFIPAFSGLGAPINDHQAASGLIGIRPTTKTEHIVRALLESIAFRVTQIYLCTIVETDFTFSKIRVDGGVSKNDFICQLLSDLTGLLVERSTNTESSVLGAAFLAGLNTGVWKSRDELIKTRKIDKIFSPRLHQQTQSKIQMKLWEKAVGRFTGWYNG